MGVNMYLNNYRGIPCKLSDEIYIIGPKATTMTIGGYTKGTEVRLISGVDGSPVPGYHFAEGYSTVCRADATQAEFIGVRTASLKKKKEERKMKFLDSNASVDEVRQTLLDNLREIHPEVSRLALTPWPRWTTRDHLLAQAALCYIDGYLLVRDLPSEENER